jgi:hypothetical protein
MIGLGPSAVPARSRAGPAQVDHQHGGLHGARSEQVQGLLALIAVEAHR